MIKDSYKYFVLLILVFLHITKQLPAQKTNIDSLMKLAENMKNDTNRINILNKLAFELRNSNIEKSKFYAELADSLSKKINYKKGEAESLGYLGLIYYRLGQYDLSLTFHFNSLNISEKHNFKQFISYRYNDIANVFSQQGQYEKSIDYYKKSIEIKKQIKDIEGVATSYNNMGLVYNLSYQYDKAIEIISLAMEIAEKNKFKRIYAGACSNIGEAYFALKKFERALYYFEKSLIIRKEINNVYGYTQSLIFLGKTQYELKNYIKSEKYFFQALDTATKYNYRKERQNVYLGMAQVYAQNGKYSEAYKFHQFYSQLKDSIYNEAVNEKIAQKEVRYEIDKKQAQIELLSKERLLKNSELNNQRMIIIFTLSGIVILIFLAIFLVRNIFQRRRTNTILTKQKNELIAKNHEINQQAEEIMAQRDELESKNKQINEQLDKLASMNFVLKEKNQRITDSINYAQRIQIALLQSAKVLNDFLPEHFIFFKPKEIVSGDFYWAHECSGDVLFAAGDCTGHGVPGAFMSLLGISLLNELVNREKNNNPAQMLNSLRTRLKTALGQDGRRNQPLDGMDIVLCRYSPANSILQFAGANNSLIMVRNLILEEYKGDKMPIGPHPKDSQEFTNNSIQLLPKDIFYIYSDGFQDQLGGANDRKFLAKNLRVLLENIHLLDVTKQEIILDQTITDYRGNQYDQIDDMLIIGIRI